MNNTIIQTLLILLIMAVLSEGLGVGSVSVAGAGSYDSGYDLGNGELTVKVKNDSALSVAADQTSNVGSQDKTDISPSFDTCDVELGNTGLSRKVACLSFSVPLHTGSTQSIGLSVLKLPAKSKKVTEDPVLMLAGGPGQAASEAYLFADRQFDKLNWNRDIYLIDQRGTGRSERFQCEALLSTMFVQAFDVEHIRPLSEQCLKSYPYDARYFTTSAAIRDFEFVRQELNITRWNLIGVSYGTRVAQHYLRMYPGSVRSVVIDSVLHPEHNLGLEVALQSQYALTTLIERCENSQPCSQSFPEFKTAVNRLLNQLRDAPIDIEFEDLRTGRMRNMSFSFGHLASVVRMSLYSDESIALLPLLINEAYANNNFAPLARKANNVAEAMNGMLALGMHNSVMCTEDVAFFAKHEKEPQQDNAIAETYMGSELIDFMQAVCSVWPMGVIDEGFKTSVESDTPVLLLSGEYDPITPAAYADRAMVSLTRARHFVLPGQGHNVSAIGCAPTLVAKFINELDLENLNADCLQRLNTAPFFIDFNGPMP